MLKAAETTKAAGASHFMLVSAQDASEAGTIVSQGHAATTFDGSTASTTYSLPTVTNYVRPGEDTYIRVLHLLPGQTAPAGALSADEVIKFVGTRVSRG